MVDDGFFCEICQEKFVLELSEVKNHVLSQIHVDNLEKKILEPFCLFEIQTFEKHSVVQCLCCNEPFPNFDQAKKHRLTYSHVKKVCLAIEKKIRLSEEKELEQQQQIQLQKQIQNQLVKNQIFQGYMNQIPHAENAQLEKLQTQQQQFESSIQECKNVIKTHQQEEIKNQLVKNQIFQGYQIPHAENVQLEKLQTQQQQFENSIQYECKNVIKTRQQEEMEEEFLNDQQNITLSFYNMNNLSGATLTKYRQAAKRFISFLENLGLSSQRKNLRKKLILQFLNQTQGQQQIDAALTSLCKGNLVNVEWKTADYIKQLKTPKAHHYLLHYRIKEIIEKLDDSFPECALYIAFLYKCGARLQDLMYVEVKQLYTDTLIWEPKKTQKYHVKREVKNSSWIRSRAAHLEFESDTIVKLAPTTSNLNTRISDALKAIGERPIQTHDFRTSRIVHKHVIKEEQLKVTSNWIGHKNMTTTIAYLSALPLEKEIDVQEHKRIAEKLAKEKAKYAKEIQEKPEEKIENQFAQKLRKRH